ncbi:MAG: hypothetical protein II623_13100 [Paludibacteraceae bacterium]|nr:hypothetical protein [Paludibacteraceae bacterium]
MKSIGKCLMMIILVGIVSCGTEGDMDLSPTKFIFKNKTSHSIRVDIGYVNDTINLSPFSTMSYISVEGGQYPFLFDGTCVVFDDTLSLCLNSEDSLYVNDYELNILHRSAFESVFKNDTLYKTFVFTEDYYDYVSGLQGNF